VIQDKQNLDSILRQAMCACILHNLPINHPVPPDSSIKPKRSWIKMMSWISLWSRVVETQGATKSLHTC